MILLGAVARCRVTNRRTPWTMHTRLEAADNWIAAHSAGEPTDECRALAVDGRTHSDSTTA